ncbi:CBS domain-containing protein [Flavobacterium luteum]|uniref:CBS domain-containing protein n=1 Tax=Flavobacterium luteum TaxID=2026654 RepID=A0A7J5AE94_9FLAO|nr:CBS domain-containing protein [Flavobacterium luteum]KAB1155870.1 CBS domain-containing protein [Flavobacterium luteum]
MTVNQILNTKGKQVFSVTSNITVYEAIKVMGEKNIGAVLIIENENLKGILSERDYARKVVLKGKSSLDTYVHEIMEDDLVTVKPSDSIDYCMGLMSSKRIRHLPVVENNTVLGLISIGDVVKGIIEMQKETIDYLHTYISQ